MFFDKNVIVNNIIIGIIVNEILFKVDDDNKIRITLIKVNIIIRIEIGSIMVKDIINEFFILIVGIINIIVKVNSNSNIYIIELLRISKVDINVIGIISFIIS